MVDDGLFSRNLTLFRRHFPALAAQLETWESQAKLVPVGDDDWDISRHGVRLYGMGAKAYARQQLDNPDPACYRALHTDRLLPSYADRTGREFHRFIHQQIAEDDATLMARPLSSQAYHVVSLGLGLGLHLSPLQEMTQCRSLVVVETDLDHLFYSLHVTDWQALFDRLDHLALVTTPQRDHAIAAIQAAVAQAPSLLDGTRLLLHTPSIDHAAIGNGFAADAEAVCRGLGFMDDDVRMVRNSYLNLKNPAVVLWQHSRRSRDWPVMIVGSGPSLDGMIDDVRRNAPHALVVAAGTATPTLLRHGIVPDFCTFLENVAWQYDEIQLYADEFPEEFKQIILLAPDTIDPRIPPLFHRAVLAMRPGLASERLFGTEALRAPNIGPTVANTALSLFLGAHFRTLIFFGLDMGARDATRHHAATAPQMRGEIALSSQSMSIPVRGNLGGTVLSSYDLQWTRTVLEETLAHAVPPPQVRNCSDGARIKGAQPCLAKKLMLEAPPTTKAEAIADVLKEFKPYNPQDFDRAWDPQRLETQLTALGDQLAASLCADGPFQPVAALEAALRTAANDTARQFLRGSLQMQMIMLNTALNHLSAAERQHLATEAVDEFRRNIKTYTDALKSFIRDLDAGCRNGPWLRSPAGEISEH